MNRPKDIWMYAMVTVVTVLIWLWAAGETRDQRVFSYTRVQFDTADAKGWVVTPTQIPVTIAANGSKLALDNLESLMRRPLRLVVAAVPGVQSLDLATALRELREIRETGATIRAVEPATVDVDMDQIEQVTSPIKPVLQGVQLVDDLKVEPAEVVLSMPSRLRQRMPKDITVEAVVASTELDRLERGVPQTLEVRVRAPDWLTFAGNVTITPPRVKLSFTIRSRVRDVVVASVPVQVAEGTIDRDQFHVSIDPQVLHNVTISAESDLARRIEAHEVTVVAIVYLNGTTTAATPNTTEPAAESRRISYFIALVPDANGNTTGVAVKGRIGDSSDMPQIQLRIEARP